MRDAFGATYYIAFGLFFIAVFASLLAVALNYAKAFRVKNTIISYIEENEGLDSDVQSKIDSYVHDMKYYVNNVNPGSKVGLVDDYNASEMTCSGTGYCIEHYIPGHSMTNNTAVDYKGDYYKVTTYVQIDFFINTIINENIGLNFDFKIPVSGETRVLNHKS